MYLLRTCPHCFAVFAGKTSFTRGLCWGADVTTSYLWICPSCFAVFDWPRLFFRGGVVEEQASPLLWEPWPSVLLVVSAFQQEWQPWHWHQQSSCKQFSCSWWRILVLSTLPQGTPGSGWHCGDIQGIISWMSTAVLSKWHWQPLFKPTKSRVQYAPLGQSL